jgi:hypothetical protein
MADPHPGIDGGKAQGLLFERQWLGHGFILAVAACAPMM